jgi:hypothetical protein
VAQRVTYCFEAFDVTKVLQGIGRNHNATIPDRLNPYTVLLAGTILHPNRNSQRRENPGERRDDKDDVHTPVFPAGQHVYAMPLVGSSPVGGRSRQDADG